MTYLLLLIGLLALYQGGEMTVNNVVKIGYKYQLSLTFIAVIIVGFGTSLPEFLTSFVAAYNQNSGIAIGNIIGSNIANILLIYAFGVFFLPFDKAKHGPYTKISFWVMMFSFLLLLIGAYIGEITYLLAIFMVMSFLAYLLYALRNKQELDLEPHETITQSSWLLILQTLIGLALLLLGAELSVTNASKIAIDFQVPESLIAISVIALGTSLPEISATIAAIRMKQGSVIAGNVIGSCIFNAFLVLGVTKLLTSNRLIYQENLIQVDIWIMLFAGLIAGLYVYARKMHRGLGVVGLAFYGMYIFYIGTIIFKA